MAGDDDGPPGDDDFDLLLIKPNGESLSSENAASYESLEVANPESGTYKVCVIAYSTSSGIKSMTHKLASWVISPYDKGGNFNVSVPGKVNTSTSAIVGMSWSGLTEGERYLGAAQFLDLKNVVQATTLLFVEPGATIPLSTTTRVKEKLME